MNSSHITSRWRFLMAARRLCVLIALSAASWGCGDDPLVQGVCERDSDCQFGLTCYEGRLCVSTPQATRPVVLRLAPPPGQGMVVEHFDAIVGGKNAVTKTWQLTRPAVVRGTVVRAMDTFNTSIPGKILATAPGKVAGTSLHYSATSYNTPRAFAGADTAHGFELLLQIGPSYNVTFWPDSDKIPPFYSEIKVGGDTKNWIVELPAEKDLVTIKGRLVSRPVGGAGCGSVAYDKCDGCKPLAGMRVVLIDAKSRVRSSRSVTDDTGEFEVRADPSGGPAFLRFEPTVGKLKLPFGRLKSAIDLPGLRKKDVSSVHVGDIDLGPQGATTKRTITVVDKAGVPVVGARVKVTAKLSSPLSCDAEPTPLLSDLRLQMTAPTDLKGLTVVSLPNDEIAVQVMPTAGTHPASWQTTSAKLDSQGLTITCLERPVQRGHLTDYGQGDVAGARLTFVSLEHAKQPSVDVVTDHLGHYEVPLDPGNWAVIVEPPIDSGLARDGSRTVSIVAGQEPLPLDVSLPAPTVMTGRVLDRTGLPLAGVLVDVMANQLESSSESSKKRTNLAKALLVMETHLLATAVTGADGRFEVLIETSQLAE